MAALLSHRPVRLSAALLAAAWLFFVGCNRGPSAPQEPGQAEMLPAANVRLRVLVVDDPEMAAAIQRRRGEWNAQTDGVLHVRETTSEQLLKQDPIPADVVIYPSRYLGQLAEEKRIVSVRPNSLERFEFDSFDVFDLLWRVEARWGDEALAVPLGSPVLLVCYRADLLEQLGRDPPATWAEYHELARLLAASRPAGRPRGPAKSEPDDAPDQADGQPRGTAPQGSSAGDWAGTIEPLQSPWGALTLLARAAAYAQHPHHFAALFDPETMDPLIAGPPFVRALEELVAAAQISDVTHMSPEEVRHALHHGECAMGLTWLSAATRQFMPPVPLGFAVLPGSSEIFNPSHGSWDERSSSGALNRPTLLTGAGRLGSVTSSSKNVPAALRLLAWLAGPEMSRQVSASSAATTLFRNRHVSTAPAGSWLPKRTDRQVALHYAEEVQRALDASDAWLAAPRIPGQDEYLAALDEAVQSALRGAEPASALQAAAKNWSKITDRLGLEAQKAAYHRDLQLDP